MNGTDINFSNNLLDDKLYENISVYDILYKTQTGPNLLRCVLGSRKQMDLLQFLIVKLNIKYYLIVGSLIKLLMRLNIL